MLSLYRMGKGVRDAKEKKEEEKAKVGQKSMGSMRIQNDITDLELPGYVAINIPDKDNLLQFSLTIVPPKHYWESARYTFEFAVPENYPFKPPKVICKEKIYHPNIDLSGNICLNVLREDWRPVLTIQHILHGLIFLMLEPNPNDPLNQEAAEVYRNNEQKFEQNVKNSLKGMTVNGVQFPRNFGHSSPKR